MAQGPTGLTRRYFRMAKALEMHHSDTLAEIRASGSVRRPKKVTKCPKQKKKRKPATK